MGKFANKTFFRFLFGFILIIAISFGVIMTTTILAESDAKKNTARVSDEVDCLESGGC
jgi:hypothetical protein